MTRSSGFRRSVCLLFLLFAMHHVSAQAPAGKPEPSRAPDVGSAYHGGLISPPLPKPRFVLTDTSGTPFDFESKTRGHVTLLFFGYTNCPDMCPMEMSLIAKALSKMPAATADQITVVFVTTDPARDNPNALRLWLDHFDRRFIGLTGTDAAIEAAQIAAGLPPARKSAVRSNGSYEVGHAAFVLAFTKDNLAHVLYPMGVTQEDLEHDLPRLSKEDWAIGR